VFSRGDNGYEEARQAAIWNGRRPDRFPDVILVASGEQDVVRGVQFAKRAGHKIGIRAGGHSFIASGIRDGGLLIDVSGLKAIEIDAAAKSAWFGAGVRANEFGAMLNSHQLAFPVGGCPTVGMSGFTMTGGYGLNGKTYGSAAGIVTAIDPDNEQRLEDLRAKVDPDGRFHSFLRPETLSGAR
jgi:FAD/FMN-containing dehydrogenase